MSMKKMLSFKNGKDAKADALPAEFSHTDNTKIISEGSLLGNLKYKIVKRDAITNIHISPSGPGIGIFRKEMESFDAEIGKINFPTMKTTKDRILIKGCGDTMDLCIASDGHGSISAYLQDKEARSIELLKEFLSDGKN